MNIKNVSVTFQTDKILEVKKFYVEILGGKITFDCDWYLVVLFNEKISVAFMTPQRDYPLMGIGQATLNLMVEDVDTEYLRLKDEGVEIIGGLQDQPWGDRSFRTVDPIGNIVYVYSPIAVSKEYENAIKE